MAEAESVTLDSEGRLLVPKPLREQAGLEPGMTLEIRLRDGRLEIEPAPRAVTLVRKGPLTVLRPSEPGPPLTSEVVERTLDEIRRGEGRD